MSSGCDRPVVHRHHEDGAAELRGQVLAQMGEGLRILIDRRHDHQLTACVNHAPTPSRCLK
jgi:hypothetical protein